jgi:hypothetical protein
MKPNLTTVIGTLAISVLGCAPSDMLPANALAHVRGLLSDEQGAPLASTGFSVCRGEGYPAALCEGPAAPTPFVQGVTDDQGFFSFDVKGDQTVFPSSSRHGDAPWVLALFTITLPHSGDQATSIQAFEVKLANVTLPELRRWNVNFRQTEGADGSLDLDWKNPTVFSVPQWGDSPLLLKADVQPVTQTTNHATFAAATREDFTALHVDLEKDVTVRGGDILTSQLHAFHAQLKPGALVPVSRGAACTINGLAQASCPFTTGHLEVPVTMPTNTTEVVVALLKPSALSRLVTHGLQVDGRLVVEVTSDGVTWTRAFVHDTVQSTMAKELGDAAGIALPSTLISQVRLRTEAPDGGPNVTFIAALNQLSLF